MQDIGEKKKLEKLFNPFTKLILTVPVENTKRILHLQEASKLDIKAGLTSITYCEETKRFKASYTDKEDRESTEV